MKIVRESVRTTNKGQTTAQEKPLEQEAEEVVSEALQAFKDRNAAEQKRREEATDSEFWFAVCFETREQKEEFLSALGLLAYGDKYLDGRLLAQKFGIVLKNKGTLGPLKVKHDRDYASLSLRERR